MGAMWTNHDFDQNNHSDPWGADQKSERVLRRHGAKAIALSSADESQMLFARSMADNEIKWHIDVIPAGDHDRRTHLGRSIINIYMLASQSAAQQAGIFLVLFLVSVLYLFGLAGSVEYPVSAFFVLVFSSICFAIKASEITR